MRTLPLVLASLASAFILAAAACGDDEGLVRSRVDGGTTTTTDGGTLACGAVVPTSYVSADFATNAAVELALGQKLAEIDAKITDSELAGTGVLTAEALKSLFSSGAPSLRAVSTAATQDAIDGYFTALGDAAGKTWEPADAAKDGGATSGGKYNQTYWFSSVGIDLHLASVRSLLGGALYNDVLSIVAAPVTAAAIDRLLAAFGATPTLANDPNVDKLLASFAARRDDKSVATRGAYRKMTNALLRMKAAVTKDTCKADLDDAVTTFLGEWERTTYASAIFALNLAAIDASDPSKGPETLHSLGEAIGLIQSFKGLSRRKISDEQIKTLLDGIGLTTPYQYVTTLGSAVKLTDVINAIALDEGFTAAEIEVAKKTF